MQNRKRWIAAIILIIVVSLLGLNFALHRFTTSKWLSAPDKRKVIISDLLDRYELVGMTEEKIMSLLGDEDGQTSFKGDRTYYPPETTLSYFVGIDFMEGVWLILSLEDGLVDRVGFGVT